MRFPVDIDPQYGSFHFNLSVPLFAELLQYQIALELPGLTNLTCYGQQYDDYGPRTVAYATFQVADPRPPTTTLNLTVPEWVSECHHHHHPS